MAPIIISMTPKKIDRPLGILSPLLLSDNNIYTIFKYLYQPFMTPKGLNLATFLERPARQVISTTLPMSL